MKFFGLGVGEDWVDVVWFLKWVFGLWDYLFVDRDGFVCCEDVIVINVEWKVVVNYDVVIGLIIEVWIELGCCGVGC